MSSYLADDVKFVVTHGADVHDNITTAAGSGNEVDSLGYGECMVVIMVGDIDAVYDVKVQQSDTSGSGFADVTSGAIVQLAATTTNANKVFAISLRKGVGGWTKRYLNVNHVAADGTEGVNSSIVAILNKGETKPEASQGLTQDIKV